METREERRGLANAMRWIVAGSVALSASLLSAACSVADIPGGRGTDRDETEASSKQGARPAACQGPERVEPQDPAKLPKCECKSGGAARCVTLGKLPTALSNQLEKCDSDKGACVPDTLIASGGKAPPTCTAKGKEGRCLSMCVPLVAKYASSVLTRGDDDACPADERCVPCENPLDGTATGVCEIGQPRPATCDAKAKDGAGIAVNPGEAITCPFKGTPADPTRFPECGRGGRCLDSSLIADPKIAARLARCDRGLCVPEIYVKEKGQHLPKSCSSFAGIEGRCFSMVFRDVGEQKELLQQDACAVDERCVPCFNPATGEPTGACDTVSCDKARGAARPLRDCCRQGGSFRGKCVPRKDVPASFLPRLSGDGCGGTDVCAPSENLDPNSAPVLCAADGGKGVCVSNCIEFDFLEELFLDRGSCRSDQTCVPCRLPSGQPSNAPGCN